MYTPKYVGNPVEGGVEVMRGSSSRIKQPVTSTYVIQTDTAILHITTEQGGRFKETYSVHMFHRQLIKGIPSFGLSDLESVMLFINGFLFGDSAPTGYDFYCDALENTFFQNPEFLDLFNVRRKQQREQESRRKQLTDRS